ncbi:transcription factor GTE10 [Cucumis melo var. makuwa]|uniref:Transcription factor GTE10 n=1 Tax=Cucumis melo var. makuwa TaxID=1194695 RepID=A0A5D3CE63_CUCMM|nr:transcription factor GTE10 [Cucumis melo var. makuwa]
MYCVRKASPDRLYRAALLRNRFADTILKAREKALEKGDKRDPEKVRMEREELERQQRESLSLYIDDSTIIVEKVERSKLFQEVTNSFFNIEKALLQAEAKAVEDAQRKAEAEVAAAARNGNDDGTDGGELRTTTNVSLFSEPFPFHFQFYVKHKRNKYLGDLLTHYLRRRKNLNLSLLTALGKSRPFPTHYL